MRTCRQTDKQSDKQTYIQTVRHKETDKDTHRQIKTKKRDTENKAKKNKYEPKKNSSSAGSHEPLGIPVPVNNLSDRPENPVPVNVARALRGRHGLPAPKWTKRQAISLRFLLFPD